MTTFYPKISELNQTKDLQNLKAKDYRRAICVVSCPHCKLRFGVERFYMGIITCPYCGDYVEG